MSYTDAISYTQSQPRPDTISCFDNPNYSFHFDQEPGTSIVQEVCMLPPVKDAFFDLTCKENNENNCPFVFYCLCACVQWDLICEKSFWRTTVATAVSLGKFLGATTFGILSDKFGRKTCFIIGSIFYISGSVLTTFSPWYWLFLIGRVLLGSSSSGLFYPAFSLCKYFQICFSWTNLEAEENELQFYFIICFAFYSD